MHRARIRAADATLAALAAFTGAGQPAASAAPTTYTHGYDVSWPQCHRGEARSMPSGHPAYVILGLTDGSGHTVNPCLRSQLSWARGHRAKVGGYLVASYPSRWQRARAGRGLYGRCHHHVLCRLRNDGARQVSDAFATMRRDHMHVPMVWLDVEFRSYRPWTRSHSRNRAVIEGIVRGMHHHHKRFGIYTTGYMWHAIVGRYQLRVPQWLPAGHTSARRTKPMCRHSATGGPTWLVQYTHRLDEDLTCPVLDPARNHEHGGHGFLLERFATRQ
jgi:hypothetical protein